MSASPASSRVPQADLCNNIQPDDDIQEPKLGLIIKVPSRPRELLQKKLNRKQLTQKNFLIPRDKMLQPKKRIEQEAVP